MITLERVKELQSFADLRALGEAMDMQELFNLLAIARAYLESPVEIRKADRGQRVRIVPEVAS